MPVFLTITFSPAIDKSTTIPGLWPDKKLYCTSPVYEPGGGGINVARALQKLGNTATALYIAGGCTGEKLMTLLQKEGIRSIAIPGHSETRENLHIIDDETKRQYRFVLPGAMILQDEWQACLLAIDQLPAVDFLIVSGSLPAGIPTDIFQEIASVARNKKAKLIIDTSKNGLTAIKNCGAYLLKPNLAELCILANRTEIHLEEIEKIVREVIANGYCEILVVSLGESGAMLITSDQFFRAIPPPVNRKSTVGAGDSMLAGIVLALSKNIPLGETLQFGVACGTAACLQAGTALCELSDVEKICTLTKVYPE